MAEIAVDPELIDRIYDQSKLVLESIPALVNQFLVLRNGSQSALARVIQSEPNTVVERVPNHPRVSESNPRTCARPSPCISLMDPDVPAVSLMGMAGTGKTFLALAAGLERSVRSPLAEMAATVL